MQLTVNTVFISSSEELINTEKWELYISAKFEQNSENKEFAYQIYKVCICLYAYVWKVDSVDKVGFALKLHFWYFTHVLPMIWGGPLLFLVQRSSSNSRERERD